MISQTRFFIIGMSVIGGLSSTVQASAADWDFEPRLEASEIYRSNVNLAPSDQEDDDWITNLMPGFTAALEGANNRASLSYSMQGLIFKNDSDQNDVYHKFLGDGNFQLVDDKIFLDIAGRYGQENIDPARRVALDNTFDTDNRTDVGTLQVTPWWRQPVGNMAESVVRYTYSRVDYFNTDDTSTDVENSYTNRIDWTLEDSSQSRVGWQTWYYYQRTEFDDAPEFEFQRAELELSYAVGSKTQILATGGRESEVDEDPTRANLGATFWSGGFAWQPTSLQSLEAKVGHRFYGTSYEFHWKRTGSRGELSVDYNEQPSTANTAQFDDATFLPDGGRLGAPRLDPEVYVNKRLTAAFRYSFSRSDIEVRVYRDERDYGEIEDNTDQGDEKFTGVTSDFTWALFPRTSLVLGVDWEKQELDESDGGGDNHLGNFTLELRRQLRPAMALSLIGGRYIRNSDDEFDYRDNSGILKFSATF